MKPGDRVLWAARNGTVRHGTIREWFSLTATWLVDIDPDRSLPGGEGFATWFKESELIPEVQP